MLAIGAGGIESHGVKTMLLADKLKRSGDFLFRWRSFILLGFAPFVWNAASKPEAIELAIGPLYGGIYEATCIALVVTGLLVRAFTVGFVPGGTSGRNTAAQLAKKLNTTGMYSLTRNPLYFGNCLTYAGVFLYTQDVLLALVAILFLVIYYERIIMAEEDFLCDRFGDAYREWAHDTPAFFPRLNGWKRPALRFSPRTVLRREYSGWFAAVICLFLIQAYGDYFVEKDGSLDKPWLIAVAAGAVIYVTLLTMKKKTRLLAVPGR